MRTQIIKLDSNDDFISVCDKLSWAKMPRILLVFPRQISIRFRKIDFLLFKRRVNKLGSQLAITTHSIGIRNLCVTLGIPVFQSVSAAQQNEWIIPKLISPLTRGGEQSKLGRIKKVNPLSPRSNKGPGYAVSLISFILGLLAVITLLLIFLPSATITLAPKITTQSMVLNVSAIPITDGIIATNAVRLRTIEYTESGNLTHETNGTILVPDGFAQGIVHFENLTEQAIGIPSGTIVSTASVPYIRFATMGDIVISPGIGESVEIPVQALEAGSRGNLSPGAISAIEGGLGTSLTVSNSRSFIGGTEKEAAIATMQDRDLVYEALLTILVKKCETRMQEIVPNNAVFFPGAISIEVLDATYFPPIEHVGDMVSVTMEINCTGHYVDNSELKNLAIQAMDANLPKEFIPQNDTLEIHNDSILVMDSGVKWEMTAERYLQSNIDKNQVAFLLLGRDPRTVKAFLNQNNLISAPPEIKIIPSWWPRLPFFPSRIEIKLNVH